MPHAIVSLYNLSSLIKELCRYSFHADCTLSKVCSGKDVQQQEGFSQCTFVHAVVSAAVIMRSNRFMGVNDRMCQGDPQPPLPPAKSLSESQCSPGEQKMERPIESSACAVKPLQKGATPLTQW